MGNIQYGALRMIVADDFSSFRATVSSMLSKLGVTKVESVATGKEVLQLCQHKRFDVVLCDYDMGHGKSGQQVLEELRHRQLLPRSSLFILVTADTSRNVVMSSYDCEPDAYLMKPITALSLEQRLSRLLLQREEMMPVYRALDDENYALATTLLMSKASGSNRSNTYNQKLLDKLFIKLGEHERAEQLYTKVLKVRALDWARVGLARAKQATGNTDAAIEQLTKLVEDNPLYLPAYDALADAWSECGENQKLQDTIQCAVDISPMSIVRQQRLGRVAEVNQDLPSAVKAFRRTVKLGQLSCHAQVDDNFGFARTVAAAKEKGLEQDSILATEAMLALGAAKERFPLSQEQELQTSILQGRVYASQGRQDEARKALAVLSEEALDNADLGLSIDLVATWRSLGDKQKADSLLKKLLEKHGNDQRALEKLDTLLEEPASDNNRKFVARINHEGIELYKQRRFDDAVGCFEKASRLFPKNTGIQLNIAQALLGKLREHPDDENLAAEFGHTMKVISGLVDHNHPQYERYTRLKAMANSPRS